MRKKLFAIVMSMTMVASFMPSFAFATPAAPEHTCTWATTWTNNALVKDGKVLDASYATSNCDYDVYNVHKCTSGTCDKYDTATAVLVKKGPMHEWSKTSTGVTNCVEKWDVYTCSTCGATEKRDVVAIENGAHTFADVASEKSPATCTDNQVMGYACTACDAWETTWEVPNTKLDHDFSSVTEVKTGDVVTDYNKVAGKESNVTVKAATCLNDKTFTVKCTRCSETKDFVVPNTKLEHSFTDAGKVNVPATCTTPGMTIYYCDTPGCTEIKTSTETSKAGHTWDAGVVEKAPTCLVNGVTKYTCTVCDATKTESIPCVGHHDFAASRTKVVNATCTEDEVWAYKCSACDEYTDPIVMAGTATGHTLGAEKFVSATCIDKAFAAKECSVCHEYVGARELTEADKTSLAGYDEDEVNPFGHVMFLSTVEDATCAKTGTKTYTCLACGETQTEAIAKLPHTLVKDAAVAATSTKTGLTAGEHCSVCNEVVTAQKVTVAKAKAPTVKAGKKSLTVKASKVTGATKYQVAYKQSGKSWKYATASTKNAQTIKSLKSGKKYYVKVRTISGSVKGAWSSTKSVKVK